MAELTQAINKFWRVCGNGQKTEKGIQDCRDNLVEETADVQNHAVADGIPASFRSRSEPDDRKETGPAVEENRGRIVATGILILAAFLIGVMVGYCCGKDG